MSHQQLPAHLVHGFLTWRYDGEQKLETHWAQMADGKVYATEVKGYTIHFGKHRDGTPGDWRHVEHGVVPDNAEFLGAFAPSVSGSNPVEFDHVPYPPYGLQQKTDLTYAQACMELGACLLHNACCDGLAVNDGA